MRTFKQLLGLALAGAMLLALAACGQQNTQQPGSSSAQEPPAETAP